MANVAPFSILNRGSLNFVESFYLELRRVGSGSIENVTSKTFEVEGTVAIPPYSRLWYSKEVLNTAQRKNLVRSTWTPAAVARKSGVLK